MIPLVAATQMRALDEETIAQLGVTGGVLMETAGRGVISVLFDLHRQGRFDLRTAQVCVVAGPGNNGGDGMVIARYLHSHGIACDLWIVALRPRIRGDALVHLAAAEAVGVTTHFCEAESPLLQQRLAALSPGDVIVDALLGTGVSRSVGGGLCTVITQINASRAITVSVDLPSGLDADRGIPIDAGPAPVIVRADYTVTFGFPKLGLCGSPGFVFAGETFVADIGIPAARCAHHGVTAQLVSAQVMTPLQSVRPPLGHKGSHGHLLCVAGSEGKLGAALLSTEAALRTGVGLCTLAAARAALDGSLGSRCPEAMTLPYDPQDKHALDQILSALPGKTAVAAGPGLLPTQATQELIIRLLAADTLPMVLDAEALNQLVGTLDVVRQRSQRGGETVLTPHPGEAARLLGTTSAAVQADRIGAVRALADKTHAVVLLKGAKTLIARSHTSDVTGVTLAMIPTGNAAMGSGGMGDVLTGMIGALLASGMHAFDAACLAAYWHGLAGDVAATRKAPGSIVLATEVMQDLDEARKVGGTFASSQPSWPVWPLAWAASRT